MGVYSLSTTNLVLKGGSGEALTYNLRSELEVLMEFRNKHLVYS